MDRLTRAGSVYRLPTWAHGYPRGALRGDVVAGITVAVLLVPQALAYATLAGLPPVSGLYAAVVALVVYALLGTSRQLAVGPVAMTALLVGAGLAPLAPLDDPDALGLAGLLAVLVGGVQVVLGVLRMGTLVNFLSQTVLIGFAGAAALLIASTQLRDLLGLPVRAPASQSILDTLAVLLPRLPEAHGLTILVSCVSIALLLIGRRLSPLLPVPLLVLMGATSVSNWLQLESLGVAVLREVPAGLPYPALPRLDVDHVRTLAPFAVTIALVSFMEAIGNAKVIAARTRAPIDPGQELVAIGGMNVASALFGGFPVGGSFSRTALNLEAGARTQLAGLVAAAMVLLVVVFFTPLLYALPRAVLASVVLVAVASLINIREARATWNIRRVDGMAVIVTFLATLLFGVGPGIAAGVGFSLVGFVIRSANPRIAELGRVEGTAHLFRDVRNYALTTRTDPSVAILRMDAPLYFANAHFLADRVEALVASRPQLRHVLLNAASWNDVDADGARTLCSLYAALEEAGVALHLVTLRGYARDVIGRAGLFEILLRDGRLWSDAAEALEAIDLPPDSPLRRVPTTERRPERVF